MSYLYINLLLLIFGWYVLCTDYEYDPIFERLHVEYYDKSLAKNIVFKFQKVNRTNFALNCSFDLLEDLDGRKMFGSSKVYVFMSNTYKFTGVHFEYNVCEQWRTNLFNIRTYMKKFGNLTACDIKKGHYELGNFMPDISQFPTKIPFNIPIKYEIDVYRDNGKRVLLFAWYGRPETKIKY